MILEPAPAPQRFVKERLRRLPGAELQRGPTLQPTMTTRGRLFEDRSHEVLDALVTAAALVAVADGRVQAVEREELVNCIADERLFQGFSGSEIAAAFDKRAQQLQHRDGPEVIIKALRPLSGVLSTQLVLRIGRRVANADHRINQSELSELLRLITTTLSAAKPLVPGVGGSHEKCGSQ